MEIYRNQDEKIVTIDSPVMALPGTVEAYAKDDKDKILHEFTTVSFANNVYSIVLPFHLTEAYSEFKVVLVYNYIESGVTYTFDRYVRVKIVNPLLSVAEVREILGPEKSDEECQDAEKSVRLLIAAHTGQDFNKSTKTYKIRGTDAAGLRLPEKIIRLNKFNAFDSLPGSYYIDPSGWYILGGLTHAPNIKADFYEYHEINGVIYNPNGITPSFFRKSQNYEISGVFGWEEVPDAVKEAAKILLAEHFCDDSIYRDRYIDAISAVDWRIQFNAGAFVNTGNVKADQLLAKYVLRRGWAVL